MLDQDKQTETNNMKAISVGLFLIILIATITVFRSTSDKENVSEKKEVPIQQEEKIDTTKIKKISAEDLAKNIRTESDLVLVDLRNGTSYKTEHIIDSINVPISSIASLPEIIAKNTPCVLIQEQEDATLINAISNALSEKGYKQISYLEGGFKLWKQKFNPTISDGDPKSFTDQAKVNYITSDELKKRLEVEKNLIIIDVREKAQFSSEHITGAINLPLDELEKRRKEIPLGKNIILYDNSGLEAFKGAVRLFDLGLSNALALSDGLNNWKKKGYELVK